MPQFLKFSIFNIQFSILTIFIFHFALLLWVKSLTFDICFVYKYHMQQTNEIKASLKREYVLYSNAVAFYKKALQEFEQKHQLSTQTFLKRFEAGQLGDEADYFDWYAFAGLLARWRKTQSAIRSAIQ